MELTNAVSLIQKFSPLADALRPQGREEREEKGETRELRPAFRRGQFARADQIERHLDKLARRMDKISSMLERLQTAAPVFSEAATVVIERNEEGVSRFSFSLTRGVNGLVTEQYAFSVVYKAAPEPQEATVLQEIPGQLEKPVSPAQAPAPSTVPTIAAPVAEEAVEEVAKETAAPQESASVVQAAAVTSTTSAAEPLPARLELLSDILAELQEFSRRIAELIEYYRIKTDGGEGEVESDVRAEAQTLRYVNIDADRVQRLYTGRSDDTVVINADAARRIYTGRGDDTLSIDADKVARVRTGRGDDAILVNADVARRIATGRGDDTLTIEADKVARVRTGAGDDALMIDADVIKRINTGSGDDTLNLTADVIKRVDAGAGDDVITLDAEDAAIAFGKGGGEDVIDIASVGALAIKIDRDLATSTDDVSISSENGAAVLEFESGEKLTINNLDNADMVSVKIGGEIVELHVSEAPVELEMSA